VSENNISFVRTSKKNSSFLDRAVRNFIFSGAGTVGTFVVGLLFAGLTIRYLGLQRAGFFMTLVALTGLNSFIGDVGLGTPAVRRVAVLNAEGTLSTARDVVGSVCTVSFFSSLVVALPVIIFFATIFRWSKLDFVYQGDAFWATLFTMGSFLLAQTTNPWRSTYNALERFDLTSALNVTFGFLTGILGISILILLPTMTALAMVRFAVNVLRFCVDAYFMRRLLHHTPWPTWAWKEIKPLMGFGGWVYIGTIGNLLLGRANGLILTAFLGSAALPYYELPQRIYSQVHNAIASTCQFLFPMFSSFGTEAGVHIKRLEDRLRWFVALASATAYLGIALILPGLLAYIITPEFASLVRLPLYLACIQGFFQAQDIIPYYSSYAMGFGKPNSVIQLVQGILVSLTALLLTPRMGFVGASIAQLWVVVVVMAHIIWIRRLISPAENWFGWLRAFVSPTIMVCSWILITSILVRVIPSAPVYHYFAASLGGLMGFLLLILVERSVFPDYQRWTTLKEVVAMPLRKVVGRYRNGEE